MSEIYRFGDLELDASLFQVRRNGVKLAVQPQVFDVLHYLLKNRDRLVSKDELLEQVWHGRIISETTLSSRIKSVRQLIGDTGDSQSLVRTVRNRGFQFVGEVSTRLSDAQMIPVRRQDASESGLTTIAVLPFDDFSGGEEASHIGQGIAADIIGLLARHHWLRVISRGSSFRYAGAAESPIDLGRILGIRYLLTGRIRHAGHKIRIDAELSDCDTGRHLWSERYEGRESDLFALQEKMSRQIAAAMPSELSVVEGERATTTPGANLDGWGLCHKGFRHLYRFTEDELLKARELFTAALERDADLAHAFAGLSYAAIQLAFYGDPANRDRVLQDALKAGEQAVALDSRDAFNHFVLGRAYSLLQRFEEAEAKLTHVLEMNPSLAQAYFGLGFSFTNSGRPQDAISLFREAVNLSPQDPHIWTFHHLRSMAHFRLGQMQDAERYVRMAVTSPNATYWPFATLCSLLANLQRESEAQAIADRLMQMKQDYSLDYAGKDFFFAQRDEFVEEYIAGLERAGIR